VLDFATKHCMKLRVCYVLEFYFSSFLFSLLFSPRFFLFILSIMQRELKKCFHITDKAELMQDMKYETKPCIV